LAVTTATSLGVVTPRIDALGLLAPPDGAATGVLLLPPPQAVNAKETRTAASAAPQGNRSIRTSVELDKKIGKAFREAHDTAGAHCGQW